MSEINTVGPTQQNVPTHVVENPKVSSPPATKAQGTPASPVMVSSGLADREAAVAVLSEVSADIEEALTVLNQALSVGPTHASISKDNELNTFVIRIFDDKSGDVIREIPNEAMQRFARNLKQIQGLLFDKLM